MAHRLLLCDDQALVRAGSRKLLESEPDITVVGEAVDGAQLLSSTRALKPTVLLTELNLRRVTCIDAIRQLRDAAEAGGTPAPKVIVLAAASDPHRMVAALRAGARGAFLKRDPPCEIIQGIRAVAEGKAALGSTVAEMLLPTLTTAAHRPPPPRPGAFDALSQRERDVICLMAEGMCNQEIAELLHVEPTTVKSHVSHVLRKLGLRDRVQAVVLAYRLGLVQPAA
jgi:DNA-binding NarL/FixJ family response regulator